MLMNETIVRLMDIVDAGGVLVFKNAEVAVRDETVYSPATNYTYIWRFPNQWRRIKVEYIHVMPSLDPRVVVTWWIHCVPFTKRTLVVDAVKYPSLVGRVKKWLVRYGLTDTERVKRFNNRYRNELKGLDKELDKIEVGAKDAMNEKVGDL